jgi:integrase/recombinase XerD
VKSFFRYVSVHDVAALPVAQRVLAIPTKRFDRRLLGYLTHDEMRAVLAAPDVRTWSGRRDHAMFLTAYNTAARVSELVRMLRADADLAPALGTVKIHGKGRKERVVVFPATPPPCCGGGSASSAQPRRRSSRIAAATR